MIENKNEEMKTRGWREYFYGEKRQARIEWKKIIYKCVDFRIIIAFLLTFLSENGLNKFRELRIKLRIKYLISKIQFKLKLQHDFKRIIK